MPEESSTANLKLEEYPYSVASTNQMTSSNKYLTFNNKQVNSVIRESE